MYSLYQEKIKHRNRALLTKQRNPKWVYEEYIQIFSFFLMFSLSHVSSLKVIRYPEKFLLFISEYVKLFHC